MANLAIVYLLVVLLALGIAFVEVRLQGCIKVDGAGDGAVGAAERRVIGHSSREAL